MREVSLTERPFGRKRELHGRKSPYMVYANWELNTSNRVLVRLAVLGLRRTRSLHSALTIESVVKDGVCLCLSIRRISHHKAFRTVAIEGTSLAVLIANLIRLRISPAKIGTRPQRSRNSMIG